MTGSGRLGRLLVGSLQHARAGWQGQAAVGGQHLLGLVNDASNLPSTSGSRSGLLGAGVIGAGAAGTAWQGSTIGQRHLSFWRRAPATPAATDGAAMASTDSQTPSEGAEAAVAESAGFFPLPEDSSEVFSAIESACAAIESATIAAAKADTWFAPAWFIGAITTAHETFGTPW